MERFRSLLAIALASLVLLSSSSFMVAIHFCQGDLKHVALFGKSEGCEEEKKLPPCHKDVAAPCCDDKTIIHEADGFNAPINDVISLSPLMGDLPMPEVIVSEIVPAHGASVVSWYNYDPPLRSYDLTLTHRVLLI